MEQTHYLKNVLLDRKAVPSFDEYPFAIPAIRHLHTLALHPNVTFLIGENGMGKSTLMEAIAVNAGLNPEGGSRNFNFTTRSSHSVLHDHIRLDRGSGWPRPKDWYYLRAESFFNVATEIENLDSIPSGSPKIGSSYGSRSLHEQSHGESFLALMMNRFHGDGVYLLDEPEAALSPFKQMSVLSIIHKLVRKNSQFIIATHSPIIMSYPDSLIYELSENGITETNYQETEHFSITRDFLNNPDRMLNVLLSE
jgi:predicted ATPase